jgi:hypothetical protein
MCRAESRATRGERLNARRRWDPDHGDRAWAPFKSDRQMEMWMRNGEADDVAGGGDVGANSWKTI